MSEIINAIGKPLCDFFRILALVGACFGALVVLIAGIMIAASASENRKQ